MRRSQSGVALIVALLVVALATVMIAGLLDRGELALARTRNQSRETQAQSYALGLEAYAARVLVQVQAQNNAADTADAPWAVPLPPTPVPGGMITAAMSDLNGRFNLNNLDPSVPNAADWRIKFGLLLQALKLDPKLAGAVVAWMDNTAATSATSDAFYLSQPVPYRAAKRQFMHVSELRLVRGFDGDVYAKLAPHLAALPAGTPINVNTATAPVLMTLNRNMTLEMANALNQHGHAHYDQLSDLGKAQPALRIECEPCYGTHSSYFLARGEITLDGLPFEFHSVMERRTGTGVRTLQRSHGID
jgi:general secretion pathway protein K